MKAARPAVRPRDRSGWRYPHDLEAARRGDLEALAILLHRSQRSLLVGIHRMAVRRGWSFLDPDDVFQDAVVCSFRAIRSLKATTERGFRSWFFGVARNLMLDAVRRRKRTDATEPRSEREDETTVQVTLTLTSETERCVVRYDARNRLVIVWRLEAEKRSVVVLRDLFRLAWEDVALVLERPTPTAARGFHIRVRRGIVVVI